jgi:predicted DsbA family dithiol-disulfide isomerase
MNGVDPGVPPCASEGGQPVRSTGPSSGPREVVIVKVEIWSDVVCPWCAIGKRRFERALSQFDHADQIEVVWRSFQLDPTAPRRREGELVDLLAAKYGMARGVAEANQARLTDMAEIEGLEFHFEHAKTGNTFDAHRLLHLAAETGLQDALKERLFIAYFRDGLAIGEPDVLRSVAVATGLDARRVDEVLGSDAFAAEVRADEDEARALGVSGVPFYVIDRRYGVSGAQAPELLLELLDKAWEESAPLTMVASTDASCDAEGCDV